VIVVDLLLVMAVYAALGAAWAGIVLAVALPPVAIYKFATRAGRGKLAPEVRAPSPEGPTRHGQDTYYAGVQMVSYDLVKELVIAVAVIGFLALVLSAVLSSPDVPAVTIQSWATNAPADFVGTAAAELAGTSTSAQYGPPYTDGSSSVQAVGPVSPQAILGNALHLDTARQFVLDPLAIAAPGDPDVARYEAAAPAQKQAWLDDYMSALARSTVQDGSVVLPAGDYGPVPAVVDHLLAIARTGNLDGILLRSGRFYQTNYSAPLLFMGDGTYLAGLASRQHLLGSQWGMMNETGSYPGQAWLAPVSFWYQIPPWDTSASADLLILITVTILGLAFAFCPWIPVVRDVPRWVPVHRLIWRHADPDDAEP
jgi:hypothetical protein